MTLQLLGSVIQGSSYLLELLVCVFLLYTGHWRKWGALFAYSAVLFSLDAVIRPWASAHYGLHSLQYYNIYWLSDSALTLAAFFLVCSLFRRASLGEPKVWGHLRLILPAVFVLVLIVSLRVLFKHYSDHGLSNYFMWEFQQNLYFTGAVLNTVLYLMIQRLEKVDQELGLVVCGMGIQYAGAAASIALVTVAHHAQLPLIESLVRFSQYIFPLCGLGMLSIWLYALRQLPKPSRSKGRGSQSWKEVPALADFAPRRV